MVTKTILVVEDERPLYEAIKIKLQQNNIDVLTARSVPQAIAYLTEVGNIDAIWLDHYLFGKETGLDLVAQIKRTDSKWKHIPIFVVSNTASADKMSIYISLGITKYFIKSNVRLDQIIAEINTQLTTQKYE